MIHYEPSKHSSPSQGFQFSLSGLPVKCTTHQVVWGVVLHVPRQQASKNLSRESTGTVVRTWATSSRVNARNDFVVIVVVKPTYSSEPRT